MHDKSIKPIHSVHIVADSFGSDMMAYIVYYLVESMLDGMYVMWVGREW